MSSPWRVPRRKMDPTLRAIVFLAACFAGLLFWTLWRIPRPLPSLAAETAASLAASGVDNPVTAVLLNFRGYDTLLEVMVFLLGVVTVWSIDHAPFPPRIPDTSHVQAAAVRMLTPLICLMGGYFIWQGARYAGGAFQGGAVLSAGQVLLLISDFLWMERMPSWPLRLGMTLGPLVFVIMALWGVFSRDILLRFPPEYAGVLLPFLEAACGISIGLILAAFFAGGRPLDDLREEPYWAGQDEGEG